MAEFGTLFPLVAGAYTFQNEFIFSGHTATPFLFVLFFETPLQKAIMLAGSVTMAISVLLTRNHYAVDVIRAYFMAYAIFALSRWLYFQFVRPLFLAVPIPSRSDRQSGGIAAGREFGFTSVRETPRRSKNSRRG